MLRNNQYWTRRNDTRVGAHPNVLLFLSFNARAFYNEPRLFSQHLIYFVIDIKIYAFMEVNGDGIYSVLMYDY